MGWDKALALSQMPRIPRAELEGHEARTGEGTGAGEEVIPCPALASARVSALQERGCCCPDTVPAANPGLYLSLPRRLRVLVPSCPAPGSPSSAPCHLHTAPAINCLPSHLQNFVDTQNRATGDRNQKSLWSGYFWLIPSPVTLPLCQRAQASTHD